MYFKRSIASVSKLNFASNAVKQTPVARKWQPTSGNSFRSFAEYRLKVVQQDPLAVRGKKDTLLQK